MVSTLRMEDERRTILSKVAAGEITPEEARRRLARRPGWFAWSWLQVIRHRRDQPVRSVGILELEDGQVRASVIPL